MTNKQAKDILDFLADRYHKFSRIVVDVDSFSNFSSSSESKHWQVFIKEIGVNTYVRAAKYNDNVRDDNLLQEMIYVHCVSNKKPSWKEVLEQFLKLSKDGYSIELCCNEIILEKNSSLENILIAMDLNRVDMQHEAQSI